MRHGPYIFLALLWAWLGVGASEAKAFHQTYGVRRDEAVKTVGSARYLYDLCGNMIVRKGDTASPESLVYDAENRLMRFAGASSNLMLVTYGYDAEGARLWKWNNQVAINKAS